MKKILSFIVLCFLTLSVFSQWVEQATGFATTSRGIKYICPVDENIVWATAYNGTTPTNYITEFTRTTNGGTTWTPGTVSGYTSGYGSSMIFAIDGQTAWMPVFNASAGGGAILKTIDGGTTWAAQSTATFTGPAGFPNVLHFWDANQGFCMGDPNGGYFEIYTTTDGGTNWTRVPQVNIPNPVASDEYGVTGFYSVVGDDVWFSTNKGRVFKSSDRGLNWVVYTSPLTDQFKIIFKDASNGIAFQINNGVIAESADGGATWTTFTASGNLYDSDIAYVPGTPNTYISTGNSAGISYSLYGCHMWTDFTSFPGQMLNTAWVSNSCGWVGNFNTDATTGGIYKFTGTIPDPYDDDLGVIVLENPTSGLVLTSTENVSVEIMNYGLNAQSNFDVSYTINGGAVVTETVAATINPGGSYTYTFTATEDFSTSGTYTINAYTSLSGDEDASNDALVTDVLLMNWVPDKRVFGEEATGTWCGWCVRGHVYLEYMQTNYPDSWIGVAVHNGDPMVEATYDAAIGTFIGGYPSGLVDRADGEKDPLEFEMAYDVRIDVIPVASVDITNINWNSGTRQLSFDVEATFAIGLTGTDYRLNAILREDNVTGTDAGYNQANYYSGGTYGAMGGYESLPNPVPAAQMTYQNVARVLFGGWDGTAGTVTANIAENETFSYTYSYTLPAEWDETNVKMVGIIIDQNTGEVMNANMSDIPVSVIENAGQDVVMYPNPTEGIVYFRNADNATITVYDILGNVIAEYQNVPSRLALNLMDQPDGTYVIRVQKDDKVSVEKMIISR